MESTSGSEFWDRLLELYTVVCQIDTEGRVTAISPLVERVFGSGAIGSSLGDLFEFKRPAGFDGTYRAGAESLGELVLGYNEEKEFALRGQLHDYSTFGLDGLCLIGVPWLWWMQGKNPEHGLGFSDFPILDIQMDQLFFASAQQTMVADLEDLNAQLQLAQQQLEAEGERRQRFFGHVSHEMRTPLNGVISALTLIKDGQFDERTTKFIGLAAQSANRLLEIINFSLDTINPQLDTVNESSEAFSMDSLIDDCLAITQARALEKGLRLERVGEKSFPKKFMGQPRLLKQVLINLIGNATKFTDDGKVVLSVASIDSADSDKRCIEFSVADQGPGIPEDAQSKIFEPFATGVTPQTQKSKGTGLGLNIAKRCVESMGGVLSVTSKEGEGAVFGFRLRLTEVSDRENQLLTGDTDTEAVATLSGNILLVDDDEENLLLNAQVLSSIGLKVETATSGQAAIEQAKNEVFNLILMDLDMPQMNGLEAARAIRDLPASKTTPIVALTAHADVDMKQRALASGMQGFLEKPMLRDRLPSQLGEWLELQAANTDSSFKSGDQGTNSRDPVFLSAIVERMQRDVGADVVDALVSKFLSESVGRWDTLQTALMNGDLPVVSREAHTLGSSCFTFGLQRAGNQFRQLESEARDERELTVNMEALAEDLGEGITGLEQLVQGS